MDEHSKVFHSPTNWYCSGETRKAALKAEFDQISATIFQLDHFVSKAAHALPAFELWKHSTCSKQLRSELAHLRSKMLPRQEFQFTNAGDILIVDDPLAQVCVVSRAVACYDML